MGRRRRIVSSSVTFRANLLRTPIMRATVFHVKSRGVVL